MHRLCFSIMVVFMVLLAQASNAQFLKRAHGRANEHPPKAILVELPTETNRIAYFTKKGQNDKLHALLEANRKVTQVMVADFRDNFSFCPVYFFYDTSIEQIKQQVFWGALLDNKLTPAKDIIISKNDTNYFIVYYGTETTREEPEGAKMDHYSTSYTGSTVPSLFALSYNFNKLRYGLPDKPRYNSLSKNTYIPQYSYEAREFDISYTPLANRYGKTLTKYYTPRKHK